MTGTPQQLIPAGKFYNKVPVLMGTNRDEFSIMINTMNLSTYVPWMNEADFDNILAYLGNDNIKEVKRVYDPSVYSYPEHLGLFSQWWWTAMRVATDHGIPFHGFPNGVALGHCSARRIADQLIRGGTPALYLYNFARPLVGGQVGHGTEVPFVFHGTASMLGIGKGNWDLSSAMVQYWTRFAATGNPSPPDVTDTLLAWPRYAPSGDLANIRLDATFLAKNISIQYGFRRQACDFWDSLDGSGELVMV